MKIYFNREPVSGPWGGGAKLITALIDELKARGHETVFRLDDPCDVYVCFDPRPNSYHHDATHILGACRSNEGRFICRVGDVGTHGKPQLTQLWTGILPHADDVVFPSVWARDYLIEFTNECLPQLAYAVETKLMDSYIVPNGAMGKFFEHRRGDEPVKRPVKVVTHHWSDNPMKGFDVYSAIDEMDDIEFTYIGRAPNNVKFKRHIPPMTPDQLAEELPKHDVYLTASRAEAGANHVLEAMACGLPVVYTRLGGSILEYCVGRGIQFDGTAAAAKVAIDSIVEPSKYSSFVANSYTCTVEQVAEEYIGIITK